MTQTYAVYNVFPPHALADLAVRERGVLGNLRNCAERIHGFPRDRRFTIGNLRYGAMIIPHDPTRSTYRAHPLDGKLVTADGLDGLLNDLALATEAGEINHLGVWAVTVFGDVIFDETTGL